MLTVLAQAKLNLTLEVLAERRDGFHEIRSVIQTINLCDSLHFQLSQDIEFKSNMPELIPENSLVSKAAGLLRVATECAKGATIEVNKRIPLVSGLGGDSSDAAATLRGLNELWGLGLSQPELVELASKLGSDVAFFVYGDTAVVKGRGETVTPLPPLPHMWVVLMVPDVPRLPGKTKQLYASMNPGHYTDGQITERLVALLTKRSLKGQSLVSNIFNVFDGVAFNNFTGLGEYWQQFLKAGAQQVHLAGSGPALFTLLKDRAQANKVYRHIQQQGMESYLTDNLAEVEKIL